MLPEEFIRETNALLGPQLWSVLHEALTQTSAPVSVRLNRLKGTRHDDLPAPIDGNVPWCNEGLYLTERPAFTFHPPLHAGAYYVQEAASMFLDLVVRQHVRQPVRMLDLCAAPGGKSTVARAALPEGSLLICNEPVRTRAQILSENMQKWGHDDVLVTNNYPRDYRRAGLMFDIILADVPCSGEGMFRKDAGAIDEWSMANVNRCQHLQRDIVGEIWPCLREGGLLVYSTCTFNRHENEENVQWICDELGAEMLTVSIQPEWNIIGSMLTDFNEPVYRFIPGLTRSEGLFMAVLKKTNGETCHERKSGRREKGTNTKTHWLRHPEDFALTQEGELLRAIPKRWLDTYSICREQLTVLHAGIALGRQRGRDLVPEQSLALSNRLETEAFCQYELDSEQAIAYLRKESLVLPDSVPRGYVLVRNKGFRLGFVKNIGTRANNLYPSEWKIRSQYLPSSILDTTDKTSTISTDCGTIATKQEPNNKNI